MKDLIKLVGKKILHLESDIVSDEEEQSVEGGERRESVSA